MRDLLPEASKSRECGIVNLDNSRSSGTHWISHNKNKNNIHYFDTFRNLQLPREVDSYNCGHLCLAFLLSFVKDVESQPVYLNG